MILYNSLPFNFKHFKDNTLDLTVNPYMVSSKHIIHWYYENNEELLALYYLVKHIKSKSRNPIHLIMPYIPGSIYDKPQTEDNIYTLKYFCEFINSLGLEKIRILDPYSYVSVALLNNAEIFDIQPYITAACDKTLSEDLYIYFPTETEENRYKLYVNKPILGREINHDVAGRDILIMMNYAISSDEEIAAIAQKLQERGASNIFLYATHYKHIENKNYLDIFNKIFTTNSIKTTIENEKIVIVGGP